MDVYATNLLSNGQSIKHLTFAKSNKKKKENNKLIECIKKRRPRILKKKKKKWLFFIFYFSTISKASLSLSRSLLDTCTE